MAGAWNSQGEDLFYEGGADGDEAEPMRINPMDRMGDAMPAMMMGAGFGEDGVAGLAGHAAVGMPPPEWANTMTVMMRNLPNKYTQRMLLAEINNTGFLGAYDFLYLPIDPETNANRGYAFLNFVDSHFAWMFKMSYEGRKMNRFNSNKVVSITPATLQGFEANYAHYANSRVNRGDPAARPLFLREPKTLGNGGFTDLAAGSRKPSGRQKKERPATGNGAGGQANRAVTLPAQDADGMWSSSAEILMSYYGGQADKSEPMPPNQATPLMQMFPQTGSSMDEQVGSGVSQPSQKGAMLPKFCPHCGGHIQPLFQFCPHCGGNLDFGYKGISA